MAGVSNLYDFINWFGQQKAKN